jgi:hypothetical protein
MDHRTMRLLADLGISCLPRNPTPVYRRTPRLYRRSAPSISTFID